MIQYRSRTKKNYNIVETALKDIHRGNESNMVSLVLKL